MDSEANYNGLWGLFAHVEADTNSILALQPRLDRKISQPFLLVLCPVSHNLLGVY